MTTRNSRITLTRSEPLLTQMKLMRFAALYLTKGEKMRQHYKPEPRRRPVWDILTALLLGVWFAILAAAYFDILWK
jgi:hypothetical protein